MIFGRGKSLLVSRLPPTETYPWASGIHNIRRRVGTNRARLVVSGLKHVELLHDAIEDVLHDRMSRLGHDGPLAELNRLVHAPEQLVISLIVLDPDGQVGLLAQLGGDPVVDWSATGGIDVGVDAPAGVEDHISQEVGAKNVIGRAKVMSVDVAVGREMAADVGLRAGIGEELILIVRVLVDPRLTHVALIRLELEGSHLPGLPDLLRDRGRRIEERHIIHNGRCRPGTRRWWRLSTLGPKGIARRGNEKDDEKSNSEDSEKQTKPLWRHCHRTEARFLVAVKEMLVGR